MAGQEAGAGLMIYESRIIERLRQRLHEDRAARRAELGNGSQLVDTDAAATGMKCARMIGVIQGLTTALDHISAIEEELSGKKRGKE